MKEREPALPPHVQGRLLSRVQHERCRAPFPISICICAGRRGVAVGLLARGERPEDVRLLRHHQAHHAAVQRVLQRLGALPALPQRQQV